MGLQINKLSDDEKREVKELKNVWKYNKIIRCSICKKFYGSDKKKDNNVNCCRTCSFKLSLKNLTK